ncbi:MAG: hypothetical protein ACRDHK_15840, partial [Actinomycetota bacterium]
MADAFGEHPRLPRPGRGDDPGRTAGVGHGGQLIGSQIGRRFPVAGDGEQAGIDRVAVDHGMPGEAGGEVDKLTWAPVTESSPAVGQHDIGSTFG